MDKTIEVKIIRETAKSVTIMLVELNRKMPVRKVDFEKRVEEGVYTVVK